jgi:hypothetical protein
MIRTDNDKKRKYVLHDAVLRIYERFISSGPQTAANLPVSLFYMVYLKMLPVLKHVQPLLCNRRINNGVMQPVSRERLGKHIPTAKNTHATIEEPVSKQRFGKHTTIGVLLETASLFGPC